MCKGNACECGPAPSGGGVEKVVMAPFVVVGAALAITLAVWVVRVSWPWLAAAGVAYAAVRVSLFARRVRRARVRRVVPAPAVDGSWRTQVTGVRVGGELPAGSDAAAVVAGWMDRVARR